ncbi:MAG: winged helix-turn-helix domain-containing protein [Promethearchaeota archaeon]
MWFNKLINNIDLSNMKGYNLEDLQDLICKIQELYHNIPNFKDFMTDFTKTFLKVFKLSYMNLFIPKNLITQKSLNIIESSEESYNLMVNDNPLLNNEPNIDNMVIRDNLINKIVLNIVKKKYNQEIEESDKTYWLFIKMNSKNNKSSLLLSLLKLNFILIYYRKINEKIFYILLGAYREQDLVYNRDNMLFIINLFFQNIGNIENIFRSHIDLLEKMSISAAIIDKYYNLLFFTDLYNSQFISKILNRNEKNYFLSNNRSILKIHNILSLLEYLYPKDMLHGKFNEAEENGVSEFLFFNTNDEKKGHIFYNKIISLKINNALLGFVHIVEDRTKQFFEYEKLLEHNVFTYKIKFGKIYLIKRYGDTRKIKVLLEELFKLNFDIYNMTFGGVDYYYFLPIKKYFKEIINLKFNEFFNSEKYAYEEPIINGDKSKDNITSLKTSNHIDTKDKNNIINYILQEINKLDFNSIIIINNIHIILSIMSFNETIIFLEKLNNMVLNKHLICLIQFNENLIEENKRKILLSQIKYLEPQNKELISTDKLKILQFIYKKNSEGLKPSVKDLLDNFNISAPTLRKKLKMLINSNFLKIESVGRHKYFVVTDKTIRIFNEI